MPSCSTPTGDPVPFHDYRMGDDFALRDADGKPYAGELPYIVISLDGTAHSEFDGWAAQAASSVLVERFFQQDEMLSSMLGIVNDSLSLYNDMTYRQKAADMLAQASKAKGAEKKALLERYKAYVKNIKNDDIKATVDSSK